jgi:hypothetical protein
MCISILGPIATLMVGLLGTLATLIVGCLVAFIAWQQWQVAQNKLRLDLFDRRYKVYNATRDFLSVIVSKANFDNSQLFTFYAGISDVEFLFDATIVDYLGQIKKRALEMRTKHKLLEDSADRERIAQAEDQHLLWLTEQLSVMGKVFTPYLGFSHIK